MTDREITQTVFEVVYVFSATYCVPVGICLGGSRESVLDSIREADPVLATALAADVALDNTSALVVAALRAWDSEVLAKGLD